MIRRWSGCLLIAAGVALGDGPATDTRQGVAARHGLPLWVTNSVGMVFTLIPPGTFVMGSARESTVAPPHPVELTRPFHLGVTEVTQAQYERVMNTNPAFFSGADRGEYPVEQIGHRDAKKFCEALSESEGVVYRLPTEAEWEYACRAGGATNGGDTIWSLDQSGGRTHPVGLHPPNAWGLQDMLGNVWEWVLDYAHAYPVAGPVRDPVCREWEGNRRDVQGIIRGGGWDVPAARCDPGIRVHLNRADCAAPYIGFRVVRELPVGEGNP